MAFLICWFIPLKCDCPRSDCFTDSVINSLGFWFVGAITAGLLGIAVAWKAPTPRTKPLPGTEDAVRFDQLNRYSVRSVFMFQLSFLSGQLSLFIALPVCAPPKEITARQLLSPQKIEMVPVYEFEAPAAIYQSNV
jgi:hypothetical protein